LDKLTKKKELFLFALAGLNPKEFGGFTLMNRAALEAGPVDDGHYWGGAI